MVVGLNALATCALSFLLLLVTKSHSAIGRAGETDVQTSDNAQSKQDEGHLERFLLLSMFGGLTNQRWVVINSLNLGRFENLTVVLPHWKLTGESHGERTKVVPFRAFFDDQHLIEMMWKRFKTRVVLDLPADRFPACVMQLASIKWGKGKEDCRSDSLTNKVRSWAQQSGVVCITQFCSFYMKPQAHQLAADSRGELTHRDALRPSPIWVQTVDGVLAKVQSRYSTTSYATVHVRTEHDFKRACGLWQQKKPDCYMNDTRITEYLKPRLKPGSLILVASGDSMKTMPTLCHQYRCWSRRHLRMTLPPGIPGSVTSNAFLDYLLALRGNAFYGNRWSSFSEELMAQFQMANLTAEYYNEPV